METSHFTCSRCGETLPLEQKRPGKGTCIPCDRAKHRERYANRTLEQAEAERAYLRQWRAENIDRITDANMRKLYGIGLEDYNRMVEEQGGLCAICRRPPTYTRRQVRFHIDHCHDTGTVRGLLCGQCNVGIGMFDHDPDRLKQAMAYLEGT